MNTKELIDKAKVRYEDLKHNERLMVSVGILLVLFVLWSSVVQSPMNASIEKYKAEVVSGNASMLSIAQQLKDQQFALTHSPDVAGKQTLKQLQEQSNQLDYEMKTATLGLIDPKMMAQVLSQLLNSDGHVKLLELNSVEPVSVEKLSGGEEVKIPLQGNDHLFRHGIVMKFESTYPQAVNYLATIEKLPWKFFWGDLNYQVKNYPMAEVTLKIYTLSDQKYLIGV